MHPSWPAAGWDSAAADAADVADVAAAAAVRPLWIRAASSPASCTRASSAG